MKKHATIAVLLSVLFATLLFGIRGFFMAVVLYGLATLLVAVVFPLLLTDTTK